MATQSQFNQISTGDAATRKVRLSQLAERMLAATSKGAAEPAVLLLADGTVFYGRASVKVVEESFGDLTVDTRMLNVEYAKNGVKAESGSFECPYAVSNGDFVKAVLRGETFTSVTVLTKIAKVSNNAWIGRTAVVADGVTYTVPADVACFNRDSQSWTTLDAARAYASQATLYVEDGTVRVIEVGG